MLYNYKDTPRDLYERLCINIELNEKLVEAEPGRKSGRIYSYPMRYAPIDDKTSENASRNRDSKTEQTAGTQDWLKDPVWTRRFIRNIDVMKGAAHGSISPTPKLAQRTIGKTFEEFIANLYMPEELLRYRNKYEKKVYEQEPKRKPGNGKVEEFRSFIIQLLKKQDGQFRIFHDAISSNSRAAIRKSLKEIKDPELKKWLKWYVMKE